MGGGGGEGGGEEGGGEEEKEESTECRRCINWRQGGGELSMRARTL